MNKYNGNQSSIVTILLDVIIFILRSFIKIAVVIISLAILATSLASLDSWWTEHNSSSDRQVNNKVSTTHTSSPGTSGSHDGQRANQKSDNAPMPDDQYYDYLKTKSANESNPAGQVIYLRKYLTTYPQGRHIGEAKALLEKAESDLANWEKEQSQGGVLVECKAQLGSGQTALVQGYIQLIESAYPLGELISAADSQVSQNTKALGEEFYVRDFGDNLRAVLSSQRLVAQTMINNGQAVFKGLPANKTYIIYGSGMAGLNFIGYCDAITSVGGKTLNVQPDGLSHFCESSQFEDGDLTARVLLSHWKPVGQD